MRLKKWESLEGMVRKRVVVHGARRGKKRVGNWLIRKKSSAGFSVYTFRDDIEGGSVWKFDS